MYRETLEEVLSSTNKVIVDSSSNSMMYLPIDKLINSSRTPKSSSTGNSFQQIPSGNSNDQGVLRSGRIDNEKNNYYSNCIICNSSYIESLYG